MTKPLNEFTADDMAGLLRRLAPASDVAVDGNTVKLKLQGVEIYLRAEGQPCYGPGLAWDFAIMGPSEWGESLPDDVVTQFSITMTEQVRKTVDHLADLAFEKRGKI